MRAMLKGRRAFARGRLPPQLFLRCPFAPKLPEDQHRGRLPHDSGAGMFCVAPDRAEWRRAWLGCRAWQRELMQRARETQPLLGAYCPEPFLQRGQMRWRREDGHGSRLGSPDGWHSIPNGVGSRCWVARHLGICLRGRSRPNRTGLDHPYSCLWGCTIGFLHQSGTKGCPQLPQHAGTPTGVARFGRFRRGLQLDSRVHSVIIRG